MSNFELVERALKRAWLEAGEAAVADGGGGLTLDELCAATELDCAEVLETIDGMVEDLSAEEVFPDGDQDPRWRWVQACRVCGEMDVEWAEPDLCEVCAEARAEDTEVEPAASGDPAAAVESWLKHTWLDDDDDDGVMGVAELAKLTGLDADLVLECLDALVEEGKATSEDDGWRWVRQCRVCGCTDDCACDGGCEWVDADLCSACEDAPGTAVVASEDSTSCRINEVATVEPLTREEEARLVDLVMRAHEEMMGMQRALLDVANILLQVRSERLWRGTHASFPDWCEFWGEQYGLSYGQAYWYRLAQSAEVRQGLLTTVGEAPQVIGQLRSLAEILDPTVRAEIYTRARDSGERMTAKLLDTTRTEVLQERLLTHLRETGKPVSQDELEGIVGAHLHLVNVWQMRQNGLLEDRYEKGTYVYDLPKAPVAEPVSSNGNGHGAPCPNGASSNGDPEPTPTIARKPGDGAGWMNLRWSDVQPLAELWPDAETFGEISRDGRKLALRLLRLAVASVASRVAAGEEADAVLAELEAAPLVGAGHD